MRNCLRSGQITVLALLFGLLGLTVGLSAASRTLSDLRQVSYVDSGVRAYAAAEAGLQAGIADYVQNATLRCTTPTSFNLTTNPIDGIQSLTYLICPASQNHAYYPALGKDDVFQVGVGNSAAVGAIDVIWSDDTASMEIISVNSAYQVSRRVAKGQNATVPANTNSAQNAVSPTNCHHNNFCNLPGSMGMESCAQNISLGNNPAPAFVRVKPLGGAGVNSVNVAICGRSAGAPVALATQTIVIEATATTTNGTVKRLQATQNPVALPSMFDNVIFSGGSLQKN